MSTNQEIFDAWWKYVQPSGAVLAIRIVELRKSKTWAGLTEVVCRPEIYETEDSKKPIAVGARYSFGGKGGVIRFVLPPSPARAVSVPTPTNEAQATLMVRLGSMWLEQNR